MTVILFLAIGVVGSLILWGRLNRPGPARYFMGAAVGWNFPELYRPTGDDFLLIGLVIMASLFLSLAVFTKPVRREEEV